MKRHQHHLLAVVSLSLALLVAAPARAASLQKVDQATWWQTVTGLPSYVNMYIYVPDTLATKPPIVVGPHSCQGNGSGTYSQQSSLVSIANKNGFIMIFPEATGQNCWDAGSDRSLNHSGKGDAPAVVQMVKYTLSKYNGDPARVYSVGQSSGGIMTEALLGVFPDVFMGGVSIMGVPCGCWADSYQDNVGKPTSGTGQWSGPCAGGNVDKTGKAWGDLVRSYFLGYTGHRPRLQHWHGTSDTTINYKNMAEDIQEWTNLLGLSETPTGTDTPKSGTTRQFWKDTCGYTVYETFALAGVGHSVGFDGAAVAAYFGLDKAGGQDPETVACPGAVPGGGGTGGAGGTSGSGGSSGTGGAGGARDGGPGGRDGGGDVVITGGGSAGNSGSSAGSSSATSGGSSSAASGGKTATSGGASAGTSASNATSGGASAGSSTSSAASGGSSSSSSSSAASGGSSGQSSGSPQARGGAMVMGGHSGTGRSTAGGGSSGCSYARAAHARDSGAGLVALLLVALGLRLRRRTSRTS